jgi:hypothetical protein
MDCSSGMSVTLGTWAYLAPPCTRPPSHFAILCAWYESDTEEGLGLTKKGKKVLVGYRGAG